MSTIRFKTEEEFDSELGKDWRGFISGGWGEPMDKLFGRQYLGTYPHNSSIDYRDRDVNIHCYVSKNYLVRSDEEEEYKKRIEFLAKVNPFMIVEAPFSSAHSKKVRYNDKGYNNFYVNVVESPTGNCQLGAISYFQHVLDRYSNVDEIKWMTQALLRAGNGAHKKLWFVDVKQSDMREKKLLELSHNKIITKYDSTNGSRMMYTIINTH